MISQTVRRVLENFLSYKIYVGFSGGADSVSLLISTNELAAELGLDITAVHFEHGIRGAASRMDARWCKDFCCQRKIKYEQYDLHTLDERKGNENVEAVARRLRIKKWSEIIHGQDECVVLLGHHADDRIENIFIRMCRGANVSGLTSMREESVLENVKIIRPLLSYSKLDLIEFLTDRGIAEWCVDHSNFDESYTRNYFRHRIIPDIIQQLPTAATGLIKAAKALEVDARFIEENAQAKYSLIADHNTDTVKILALPGSGIGGAGAALLVERFAENGIRSDLRLARAFSGRAAAEKGTPDTGSSDQREFYLAPPRRSRPVSGYTR